MLVNRSKVITVTVASFVLYTISRLRLFRRKIVQTLAVLGLSVAAIIICFGFISLSWLLRDKGDIEDGEDMHDPASSEIWSATHRKAVERLSTQVEGSLTPQECHFWFVYEKYNEKAAARTIARIAAGEIIDVDDKVNTSNAVRCPSLPVELVHTICSFLQLDELKAMRLTNKEFSDIAAEFLFTQIRIDTNFESFKQLKYIAKHPNLRKGIRRLKFEAGLQADLGCIHHYKRHYDLPHHGKPQPPEEKSGRTARLYARNLDKFNKETEAKYGVYRQTFESQQLLVNQFRDFLYPSTQSFTNLQDLRFHCGSICPHNFSEQFRNRYTKDCAIPQSDDPAATVWQLERLLRPGLRRLHMNQISPKLFNGEGIRDEKWLGDNFASLEKLNIGFRQDRDENKLEDTVDDEPVLKTASLLPYALQHATNLDLLQVNFMPNLRGSAAKLESIMPNVSFEKLARLDLDYFTARSDDLLKMLKAQTKLYWLALANVTLSQGTWPNLADKMRTELRLEEFMATGYLEDSMTQYMMAWCNRDQWSLQGIKFTLADALDRELTDHDTMSIDDSDDEEEPPTNSLYIYEDEFQDPETLLEHYGPIDNESDESDDYSEGEIQTFQLDDAAFTHGPHIQYAVHEDDYDDDDDDDDDEDEDDEDSDSMPGLEDESMDWD